MTRAEIVTTLQAWIYAYAIDPYDAWSILSEIDHHGTDRETFADYLDGAGYPNLAKEVSTP